MMTPDAYEKLNQFNANIHQALLSLHALEECGAFSKKELGRFASHVLEVRAACCSYLLNVMETDETETAGVLFRRRVRRERKEG